MGETRPDQPATTQAAGRPYNRRRQIIVNKPMQSRIVFTASWPTAICLAATAMMLAVFCSRLHDEAMQADVELPSLVPVFAVSAVFLVVATVYVVFSALMLSHRIAGPVYNIGKTLERFRGGDQSARVRLRKRDHLVEAAEYVNTTLEWMTEQLTVQAERTDSTSAPAGSTNFETEPATAAASIHG